MLILLYTVEPNPVSDDLHKLAWSSMCTVRLHAVKINVNSVAKGLDQAINLTKQSLSEFWRFWHCL